MLDLLYKVTNSISCNILQQNLYQQLFSGFILQHVTHYNNNCRNSLVLQNHFTTCNITTTAPTAQFFRFTLQHVNTLQQLLHQRLLSRFILQHVTDYSNNCTNGLVLQTHFTACNIIATTAPNGLVFQIHAIASNTLQQRYSCCTKGTVVLLSLCSIKQQINNCDLITSSLDSFYSIKYRIITD